MNSRRCLLHVLSASLRFVPVSLQLFLAACLFVPGAHARCVDYGKYLHCAGNLDTEYTRLIARSGPLAFTACFVQSGTGIQVIDINPKDPSGPQVLSTLPLGTSNMASCIAASGRYAFVVEGHGYCQGGDRKSVV